MKITIDLIKSFDPCEDGIDNFESKYPKYNNTLVHLLSLESISYSDKIWLACKVVDTKILIQWSVECAEHVIDNYNDLYPNDSRISDCIKTVKKYLNGECEISELNSALHSARSAADSAARSAAYSADSAARSALHSARSASYSALHSARSAAYSAARSAYSADSAAYSAAHSVAYSAYSAARSVQEDINLSLLIALVDNLDD